MAATAASVDNEFHHTGSLVALFADPFAACPSPATVRFLPLCAAIISQVGGSSATLSCDVPNSGA
jgi:hypothetical protein